MISARDTPHLSKTETAYFLFYFLSIFFQKKKKKKKLYAVEAESVIGYRWTHAAGIISLPATTGPLLFDCGSYVNAPKSPT
jgi:hypothetical protein